MALVRWDPFREMTSLQNAMNRLFEDRLSRTDSDVTTSGRWFPSVDIHETPESVVLRAEIPGLSQDDVSVSLEGRHLTISGEKKEDKEIDEDNYHRVERRYGKFSRTFTLPSSVDRDQIDARMRDGVLELKLAKLEESQPKQIDVKWE